MPYWGSKPEDSDYASTAIGAYIYLIKERMMTDIASVLEDSGFPEQGMIATLTCLRLLGERFPHSVSVLFGKKEFAFVKQKFDEWYEKVSKKIPSKYRDGILKEAQDEFALFEERILKPKH